MPNGTGAKRPRERSRSSSHDRDRAAAHKVFTGQSHSREDASAAIRHMHHDLVEIRQISFAFRDGWEVNTANSNEALENQRTRAKNHNEAIKEAQSAIKAIQALDQQNHDHEHDLDRENDNDNDNDHESNRANGGANRISRSRSTLLYPTILDD